MEAALKRLDRKAYTRRELTNGLIKDGFAPDKAVEAAERLSGWGYLNDRDFGAERIRILMERDKSRAFVSADLEAKGLAQDLIDALLDEFYPEDREVEIAGRFLRKRAVSRNRTAQSLMASLARAGFTPQTIRRCMPELPESEVSST